jgi:hypothetical protein
MLCQRSTVPRLDPALQLLSFGRDEAPTTWADMVQVEVAGARAALDRIESIDPGAVAHGPLLEVLTNCRTLSMTADRLCDEQERRARRVS